MCPNIERCISFDGQGFSEHFIKTYSELIKENLHKIKTIAACNDFVNTFLHSIGETVYVKNEITIGDFREGHLLTNIIFDDDNFDKNGNVIAYKQDYPFELLNTAVDALTFLLSEDDEEAVSDIIGVLVSIKMADQVGPNEEDINHIFQTLSKYLPKDPSEFVSFAIKSSVVIATTVAVVVANLRKMESLMI
jgi:hypothetical protein